MVRLVSLVPKIEPKEKKTMWSRLTIVFEKPPYFIIHLVPCPFASFKLFTGILVALALRNAFFVVKTTG